MKVTLNLGKIANVSVLAVLVSSHVMMFERIQALEVQVAKLQEHRV